MSKDIFGLTSQGFNKKNFNIIFAEVFLEGVFIEEM